MKIILSFVFLMLFAVNSNASKYPSSSYDRRFDEMKSSSTGVNFSTRSSRESIGKNFLWLAALEVIDFLPISHTDFPGGVIITEWTKIKQFDNPVKIVITIKHSNIEHNSFDLNIYVKDENNIVTRSFDSMRLKLETNILIKAKEMSLRY